MAKPPKPPQAVNPVSPELAAPAPEAPAAPTGSIFRNPQQGVVNVLDVVFDAGATVTLTEEQLNNEQIMRRVNHAVNIGVLTAV